MLLVLFLLLFATAMTAGVFYGRCRRACADRDMWHRSYDNASWTRQMVYNELAATKAEVARLESELARRSDETRYCG